jgi:hypothetical protein
MRPGDMYCNSDSAAWIWADGRSELRDPVRRLRARLKYFASAIKILLDKIMSP